MTFNWKFWQKSDSLSGSGDVKSKKLRKPRELPDRVGRHMVVKMALDPDWVWNLKCVLQKHEDGSGMMDIRIFDARDLEGIGMKLLNYASLDAHPAVILYEGRYKENTDQIVLEKHPSQMDKSAA